MAQKLKTLHWKEWIVSKEVADWKFSYRSTISLEAESFKSLGPWVESEFVPGVLPLLPPTVIVWQRWSSKDHPRYEITLDEEFWKLAEEASHQGFYLLFGMLRYRAYDGRFHS